MKSSFSSIIYLVPLFGAIIILSGCATLSQIGESISKLGSGVDEYSYTINSSPSGSIIKINNVESGITPVELKLFAKKNWVGILVEPGGWKYENNSYFIKITSPDNSKSRSVYINPRNPEGGRNIHLTLIPVKEINRIGKGRILGIKESFLPTFKSTGYVKIVEVNGTNIRDLEGSSEEVVLPAGNYNIGTICKWDLGINGEMSFENFWPIELHIEADKKYQLKTDIIEKNRCSVSLNES